MSMAPHAALQALSSSLAGLRLRNRLAVAPMTRISASPDGLATEAMRRYYTAFAEGGFGLIITEGTYPDLAHSQGFANQPGLATDAQAKSWRPVVDAVHDASHGADADAGTTKIIAQLMHAGALVHENPHRVETIAPSAVLPMGEKAPHVGGHGPYSVPRAMTEDDIHAVADSFVQAAVRAQDAGFDGVEIHAANGYLLDQFLTTYTNQRTDRYGGDVANRIRFTVEVLRATVHAVGSGFVVGVRLSESKVNDASYVWPGGADEARAIFAALRDAGASYLHIASDGRDFEFSSRRRGGVTLSQFARYVTGRPVFANGKLDDATLAARALRDGHADVIALGRAALANPDWPSRLAQGIPFDAFELGMLRPVISLQNAASWRAARCIGNGPAR